MKGRMYVFSSFSVSKQRSHEIRIVVLLVGMLLLILSCNSKVASVIPADLISTKKIPTIEATDFETFFTDSGIVRYFLKTPKLLLFSKEKDPYKEFPEGFHLKQFDANKKIISELSANYGKNFEREQKWYASGNVLMVNNKGDTLRTEELIYMTNEDRIYSDKFVNIKKGDQDVNGKGGFESDSQMKKWTFKKIHGTTYVADK